MGGLPEWRAADGGCAKSWARRYQTLQDQLPSAGHAGRRSFGCAAKEIRKKAPWFKPPSPSWPQGRLRMATDGDEMDIVEPDWLEMERRQIDALGPKFEALVDKAMHPKLGCPPAKREDVRVSLYRAVDDFRIQRW